VVGGEGRGVSHLRNQSCRTRKHLQKQNAKIGQISTLKISATICLLVKDSKTEISEQNCGIFWDILEIKMLFLLVVQSKSKHHQTFLFLLYNLYTFTPMSLVIGQGHYCEIYTPMI